MAKYAYLDRAEILHISASEDTAKEYAKATGIVVATELPAAHGYPLIITATGEEEAIVYGPDEIRLSAKGPKLDPSHYPALVALWKECKGE